jgi:hypothetical protein
MDMVKLNNLREILEKLYWMETKLEFLREKSASFKIHNDDYLDVLFKISEDSSMHREILEFLISHIENIDLLWLRDKVGHIKTEFDFNGLSDNEIMKRIIEEEYKASMYYKKVFDETDRNFIKEVWKDEDYPTFFNKINFLVSEEKKHIDLLESVL